MKGLNQEVLTLLRAEGLSEKIVEEINELAEVFEANAMRNSTPDEVLDDLDEEAWIHFSQIAWLKCQGFDLENLDKDMVFRSALAMGMCIGGTWERIHPKEE